MQNCKEDTSYWPESMLSSAAGNAARRQASRSSQRSRHQVTLGLNAEVLWDSLVTANCCLGGRQECLKASLCEQG